MLRRDARTPGSARQIIITFALVTASLLARPVSAAEWAGMLGYASDNLSRGYSLSDGQPAWLADLHVEFGNTWVVGLGATEERPPLQSAGAQLTAYVDRRWRVGENWVARIGIVHYESPWNVYREARRYDELGAAIGYRGRWSASIAVAPRVSGLSPRGRPQRGMATFLESNVHQPIAGRLAADFGIGYADYQRIDQRDYAYGSAGLRYGFADVYLFAALVWTNPAPQLYGLRPDPRRRWVASVVWSF